MVGFDRSQTRDSNQIKSLSPTEYTALLPGGSDLQKENREGISTCLIMILLTNLFILFKKCNKELNSYFYH